MPRWVQKQEEMMGAKVGPGGPGDDGYQDELGRTRRRQQAPRWVEEKQEEMRSAKMCPARPSRDDGCQDEFGRTRRR